MLRSQEESNVLNDVYIYIFGGFSSFQKWFVDQNISNIIWGNLDGQTFYTLKNWLSFTGLFSPPKSLHYEFVNIDNNSSTNVYSLFRPLIEDFGIILSIPVILLFSFFGSYVTRVVFIKKKVYYLPLLTFFLTFSLFTFYTSILNDFRIFLGILFSQFVLRISYKLK
jgi:oligosaccharide repeat unit polymerase